MCVGGGGHIQSTASTEIHILVPALLQGNGTGPVRRPRVQTQRERGGLPGEEPGLQGSGAGPWNGLSSPASPSPVTSGKPPDLEYGDSGPASSRGHVNRGHLSHGDSDTVQICPGFSL